jgi:hypothetical protein
MPIGWRKSLVLLSILVGLAACAEPPRQQYTRYYPPPPNPQKIAECYEGIKAGATNTKEKVGIAPACVTATDEEREAAWQRWIDEDKQNKLLRQADQQKREGETIQRVVTKAIDQWHICLGKAVKIFAVTTKEDANTVVDAAFGACIDEERILRNSGKITPAAIDSAKLNMRQPMLAEVLATRVRPPAPSPPPPAEPSKQQRI